MSESAIAARWAALRAAGRTGLVPYLTAGYPDRATSLAALTMLDATADVIELGIPFSDPVADGPVIQRSTFQALEGGMTVAGALAMVREAAPTAPVVAFSYLNPLFAYGLDRFVDDALAAGVSGLILTDVPAGADPEIEEALRTSPLDLIRLIAPTTNRERLGQMVSGAQGFLYLIARLGVTGAPTTVGEDLGRIVRDVRAVSDLPLAVGFGIGSGAQARAVAALADGVVVGSALVERLADGVEAAGALMRELREAVDTAPVA